ncbi:MAG: GAF domain-containing protein [Armatimonadetes bacterium]|nr:GAF domain-containing protein [Armatimonadota bacterium]
MASEALSARVEQLLAQLRGDTDTRAVLQSVIDDISAASGCESVGIRWKAGEDYPYYVTRGFGRDFVVREGPLCERDAAGLILRHADGTPQLACMCGAVVQGRTDARLPIFTPGGSFWTNGTTRSLREGSPGQAAGTRTRNYCNEVGYESVALIPLRSGDQTCGLLQLNSRTPGRFTEQQISEYELLAKRIAETAAGRVDESQDRPLLV